MELNQIFISYEFSWIVNFKIDGSEEMFQYPLSAESHYSNHLVFCYQRYMRRLIYDTPIESEEDLVARIEVVFADIVEVKGLFEDISQSLRRVYRSSIEHVL